VIPAHDRVLLVESGSRNVFDRLVPLLYQIHGEAMELDLITCHANTPAGFRGRVFRVQDYPHSAARAQLVRELKDRRYAVLGILCSNEPIMTKWKWMLAARLPAKVLVVNENADALYFDWAHRRQLAGLARARLGITGASAVPSLSRVLLLPFSVLFLILYAAFVHTRRLAYMLLPHSKPSHTKT